MERTRTEVLRFLASEEGRRVMSGFVDQVMDYPALREASRAAVVDVLMSADGIAVIRTIADEAADRALSARTGEPWPG